MIKKQVFSLLISAFTVLFTQKSLAKPQGLFNYNDLKVTAEEALRFNDYEQASQLFLEHSSQSLKLKKKEQALSSFKNFLKATEQKPSNEILKSYRTYLRAGGDKDLELSLILVQHLQAQKNWQAAAELLQRHKSQNPAEAKQILRLQAQNYIYLGELDKANELYQTVIDSSQESSHTLLEDNEQLLLILLAQKEWQKAQEKITNFFAQGELKKTYYELYLALAQDKLKEALLSFATLEKESFKTAELPHSKNLLMHLQWQLRTQKLYAEALSVINKIIEATSQNDSTLLLSKADILLENKSYEQALAFYEKYLEVTNDSPWLAETKLNIAHLYTIQKTDASQEKALSSYLDALKAAQGNNNHKIAYQASLHSAKILAQIGKDDEAIKNYTFASIIAKNDEGKAQALCLAGQVEFRQAQITKSKTQFAKASIHFHRALKLESSLHRQALLHYGFAIRFAGLKEKALEAFTKLRTINFNSPAAIYLQGLAFIENDEVLKGIKQLKSLAKTQANDPYAKHALLTALKACTFQLKGQNRQLHSRDIIASYKKLAKPDKNAAEFLHLKALNSWYQNNDDEALKDWQVFTSLYPSHKLAIEVQLWQAFTYYKSQDFDKAIQLYEFIEKSSTENPLSYQAYYQQVKIYDKLQKHSKARKINKRLIEQFEESLKAQQKLSEVAKINFLYAQSLSFSRNYNDVDSQLNKVIQNPSTPKSLKHTALGRIADNSYKNSFKNKEQELQLLEQATQQYAELATSSSTHRIQALYKQAITHLKISQKSTDSIQKAKQIEKASDLLSTLLFETPHIEKKSPYYFARASYELGRIFTQNDQQRSAKVVYQKLLNSKVPGSQDAHIFLQKLNSKTEEP